MRIEITRTIDVPDDLDDVNSLETIVREEGFALMRELMSSLWQRFQARRHGCPKCGSEDLERHGHKSAQLMTAFGPVELARRRERCRRCGTYFQPLDEWLAQLGDHRMTPFVQELSCLAAASWPYEACEAIVERILLGRVSHEQIRRVGRAEGQRVVEELEAEAQTILETPVFDEGEEEDSGSLNVALDGNWVRSRDNAEGMEAKVGVVYQGAETIGKGRRRLLKRRYAATFKGSELLGKLIYAQASKLGVEKVERLRVLGDGAKWIDTVSDEHFERAKRVLDLWHLERQLSRGLKSAIGDKEELRRERQRLDRLIRTDQVDEVLQALRSLADQSAGGGSEMSVPKELGQTISYIDSHRHAIIDYEADKAAGEHVGSGAIEKAGDLAINRRFKGRRGMRWWRDNANALLALRILHLNGDWSAHWKAKPHAQSTLPAA